MRNFLDIPWEIKTNPGFKSTITRHADKISALEILASEGKDTSNAVGREMMGILRACDYNPGLLVPYYFPAYPEDKPLSLFNRPFAFAMFNMQIGGSVTVRASRQIGKSTAFVARQKMMADLLPGRRSLYIVPHRENLDTYANRFREMERAFRFPTSHPNFRQNLTYKEYPNGSVTEMLRLLSNANDARGKTTDDIFYDECCGKTTDCLTFTQEGKFFIKKIVAFLAGDNIVAFDEYNNLRRDTVKSVKCKGIRHTWRVTTSAGQFLECTGNERFRTASGWVYLAQLLSREEASRCSRTAAIRASLAGTNPIGAGHTAGGCPHVLETELLVAELHGQPRSQAGGLLSEQIRTAEELRQHAAAEPSERRLGRGTVSIQHGNCSRDDGVISTMLRAQPSAGELLDQDPKPEVVGEVDLGGDCLVVSGRRDDFRSGECGDIDSRLHAGAGTASGGLPHPRQGVRNLAAAASEAGENLLVSADEQGGESKIHLQGQTVHARNDALQNGDPSGLHLCVLPNPVLSSRDHSGAPLLSGGGLPSQGEATQPESLRGAPGASRDQRKGQGERRQGSSAPEQAPGDGSSAEAGSGVCPALGGLPESVEGSKQDQSGRAAESSRGDSGVQGADGGVEEIGRWGSPTEGAEEPDAATAQGLQETRVVSIEYAGEQEVWDIETEEHHTFFANGIAVHNCQNMDPSLELEIEMTQKASKSPSTVYAGTSLTLDTMLEAKWDISSQGAWHLLCGCGNDIDLSEIDQIIPMIQPGGPTCPVCSRVLDVTVGRWIHKFEDQLVAGRLGLHVPQMIIPEYANDVVEWFKIYEAFKNYDLAKFLQEIFGIATEESARELTKDDLHRMCCLPEQPSTLQQKAAGGYYRWVISGCDWGGSDYVAAFQQKISTTVHAMLGLRHDGDLDVIHLRRHEGMGYREIIKLIVSDHVRFGGGPIATDFGVGAAYNMLLRESPNIIADRHVILNYVGPNAALLSAPQKDGWYNQFSLNRTESISSLFGAIKRHRTVMKQVEGETVAEFIPNPRIRCGPWELHASMLSDFLNLVRVPTENSQGATAFKYRRHGSRPDDCLHAVNFAFVLARILIGESIVDDKGLRELLQQRFGSAAGPTSVQGNRRMRTYSG